MWKSSLADPVFHFETYKSCMDSSVGVMYFRRLMNFSYDANAFVSFLGLSLFVFIDGFLFSVLWPSFICVI